MNDHVSKEIAALLWEKGYDYPVMEVIKTINWYNDKFGEAAKDPSNWLIHEEIIPYESQCVSFEQPIDNGAIKKCTITPLIHLYDAQKWLREKGFIVLVDIDFTELSSFYCNVYNKEGLIALQTIYCDSYETALEEGLETALKNLFNMGLIDGMAWEKENPKELQFHKKRTMFYLDNMNIPVFPEEKYENMSHLEWFDEIGLDISTNIRGYIGDGYIHLYYGIYFVTPNISTIDLIYLATYFKVNTIKLGCKMGEIGELWESIHEFKII